MSRCPAREALDELALHGGDLDQCRAHLAACARCSARVEWVRREAEAVRQWAAQDDAPVAHLWAGVQSRIRTRLRQRFVAVGAAGLAIAALFFARPHVDVETTASALTAIDGAEVEYRKAAEALEGQVAAQVRTPDQRKAIAQARTSLQRARLAGARDAAGRVRVLEGYATYLRSLRRALQ
jgi:hypothetical protein